MPLCVDLGGRRIIKKKKRALNAPVVPNRNSSIGRSLFFFFKQKTAYEISECDWSSDVCSSDLQMPQRHLEHLGNFGRIELQIEAGTDEAHDGRHTIAADDQVIG